MLKCAKKGNHNDCELSEIRYTQKEKDGLYELTDEARAELVNSKYYNDDLAPTTLGQRTWSTYHVASLWIGMVISIPVYTLASSLIILGLSTWQALLNILLGNLLVLIPMQLNSHAGTKYGIPYPVFARLSFGAKGSQIASIARALVGCGWVGIQTWIGGLALHTIACLIVPSYANVPGSIWITFLVFWFINIFIAYKGSEWIKHMEGFSAPVLGILGLALFIWATKSALTADSTISIMNIVNQPSNPELLAERGGFWPVFMGGLSANIAFWATMALNIPDFSRFARSQKVQFRGQLYGLPTTMTVWAFIGAYVTTATIFITGAPIMDPVEVIAHIDNIFAAIFGALGVLLATLTTNISANIVGPANGFSNIAPNKISYGKAVIITGVIAIIIQPWKLLSSAGAFIFDWLGTYGIMLGPLAGIFIADYYIVKKKNIDVMALFQGEEGRYWYKNGFNTAALIAWAVGCIPPTIGKLVPQMSSLADNGYMISFVVAFVVYCALMKKEKVSLVSNEEEEAMTLR